jgi:hypothetical protein
MERQSFVEANVAAFILTAAGSDRGRRDGGRVRRGIGYDAANLSRLRPVIASASAAGIVFVLEGVRRGGIPPEH